MATRKPILNGILQSDLDGAGWAGTSFSGLQIVNRTTKEIYLGKRTGGKAGSGSKIDPFDATTRLQFDTIMSGLDPDIQWIVNLDDNEFLTYGNIYWRLPAGSQLIGAGKNQTIIKLDPGVEAAFPGVYTIGVLGTNDINNDGLLVDGMTLDANWPALEGVGSARGVGGVGLHGDNISVRNVKVINQNGIYPSNECFGIIIINNVTGSPKSCRNALIEYCEAEQFYGNYHSAITIAGGSVFIGDYGFAQGGKILNCVVRSPEWNPTDNPFPSPLVAFGCDGGVVANCFSYGAPQGFRSEQGKDVVVKDCGFYDVWSFGVDLNGSRNSNSKVTGNTIEIRDDHPAQGYAILFTGDASPSDQGQHIFSENRIRLKITGNTPGNPATRYSFVTWTDLGHGNMILNNIVDDGFQAQYPVDIKKFGNIHPDGTSISNLLDSTDAASRPDNENGALWGSLLLQAEFTSGVGYVQYYFDAASYVVQTNDILAFEIFCDESNVTLIPYVELVFDDATKSEDLVDQNGLYLTNKFSVHDPTFLNAFASGRWYRRFGDLSDYVGKTVTQLGMGDIPGASGTNKYYYRNIRIFDSATGQINRSFFVGDLPVAPVLTSQPVDAVEFSFGIVQAKLGTQTLPYAANVSPHFNDGSVIDFGTMTGALAVVNPGGAPFTNGDRMIMRFVQDGTGHAVTWGSDYDFGTDYTSAMVPTTASAQFEVEWRYNSTADKWRCVGMARGF